MTQTELIAINEFCEHHHIELRFVQSLEESGLIEVTTIEKSGFIHSSQLRQLEKWVRLYYDMDINLEGIETITHLLEQINSLQREVTALKNRLRLYEDGD